MASWRTIEFEFDLLKPLRPPLEAVLSFLEAIEAILEALLDLIKVFLADILNPIRAIVAALLAALRAIINQIASTGFSMLLVYPDFSQPDFAGVLNSVSGAYPGFESKVINKFYDTNDIFRPQYGPGMTVGMIVLYLGADSPGDIISQIFSLIALFKQPIKFGLPAPVNVRAVPITQGGDAATQFRALFEPGLEQAIQLEWDMPTGPSGSSAGGFAGQLTSMYNSFTFPNFIIERTGPFPPDGDEPLDPRGEVVKRRIQTQTLGKTVELSIEKYNLPKPNNLLPIREEDGSVFRYFPTKFAIRFGADGESTINEDKGDTTSAFSSTINLVRGRLSGTYRYLDDDENLVAGKTYYYRIRAFFGDPKQYITWTKDDLENEDLVDLVQDLGQWKLAPAPELTLSKPSPVISGFVPRKAEEKTFKPYQDIYNAVRAGLLLNFELPPAFPQRPPTALIPEEIPEAGTRAYELYQLSLPPEQTIFRSEQMTGWGTLGVLAGPISVLKSSSDSAELINSLVFNAAARRLANRSLEIIANQPFLEDMLADKWDGVRETVNNLIETAEAVTYDNDGNLKLGAVWSFPTVIGGITTQSSHVIDQYLNQEENYAGPIGKYNGPFPVVPPGSEIVRGTGAEPQPLIPSYERFTFVGTEERADLAAFLRTALAFGGAGGYLSWYSITIGDFFPALIPMLRDFEQWLLALLKAIESAIKEITDIIENIIKKIRVLMRFVEMLIELTKILNIRLVASLLTVGPIQGSVDTLVQQLQTSEDKPGDSPYGLHSGLVMTFGVPGQGLIAAFDTLIYLLTFGSQKNVASDAAGFEVSITAG